MVEFNTLSQFGSLIHFGALQSLSIKELIVTPQNIAYSCISFAAGFLIVIGRLLSAQDESFPSKCRNTVRTLFQAIQILGLLVLLILIFSLSWQIFLGQNSKIYPLLSNPSSLNNPSGKKAVTQSNGSILLSPLKPPVYQEFEVVGFLFWFLIPVISSLVGGLMARLLLIAIRSNLSKGSGLRDISEMEHIFQSMKAFDPLSFIDVSKGVFVGLQSNLNFSMNHTDYKPHANLARVEPIYIPWLQFRETHAQILGSTGSGKGIALGVLGYQFALHKETLIVFDPKGDARLPKVLAQGAMEGGADFIHLDLQPSAVSQFNLLEGATEFEIEELLVGGLGLQPSSGDGNYYRGIDQDAAEQVSKIAIQSALTTPVTLPNLLSIAQFHKQLSKADNFVRRLRQVCELKVIQTGHGIGMLEHIEKGSVIYIRGSTDNHRVKMLQTMLLIRILQIVKSRSTHTFNKINEVEPTLKPVCLILDEFKHLLSPVALDMLGVVRELGCHALLAHQSLADLAGCPGLDRKDVEPVVIDNATLKLVFRIGDDQAARGFANKSGQERTYKEGIKPGIDPLDLAKSWTEVQQTRMSADLFLHLHRPSEAPAPFTAGVLFGLGLAKLFSLSPIRVSTKLAPPLEAPLNKRSAVSNAEDLI